MSKIIDLTGNKYGRLTVVSFSHLDKNAYWNCICECGNKTKVTGNNIKRLKVVSCGCYKKEKVSRIMKKHGDTNTRFYRIWAKMLSRTTNKNECRYPDYGGRGVWVCERWTNYQSFKEDMYDSYLNHVSVYGEKNTSIDRKDNDKGYNSDNCKWSTRIEQASNTRKNRFITYNGQKMTIAELSRKHGVTGPSAISWRINNGWSLEKALTTKSTRK